MAANSPVTVPQFAAGKVGIAPPLLRYLDGLAWPAALVFESFGLTIKIRASSPEALLPIEKHLPPGWAPSQSAVLDAVYSFRSATAGPSGSRYHRVYVQGDRLVRTLDGDDALEAFESHLQLYVAENARGRVFVHAGVVGWMGHAIVIPGQSFSGKSTLVAALIRAGASYYSDEYAVLDKEGRVYPYARALSLREGPLGSPIKRPAAAVGSTVGNTPLPVGLIVVTRYESGAGWKPKVLTEGQASMALLANTVCARSRTREAFETIALAVNGARAIRSSRDEAESLVPYLLREITLVGAASAP